MSLASLFIGPGTILLDFETPDTRGELAMLWAVAGAGVLYLALAVLRLVAIGSDTTRWQRWRNAGIGLVLVATPLAVIAGMAPWTAAAAAWLLPVIAVLIDRGSSGSSWIRALAGPMASSPQGVSRDVGYPGCHPRTSGR